MHDELWAGVELKIENAEFFSEQMGKALLPPDRNPMNIALESTGAIIETRWQRSLYANLDAFLAMVRSVPEIIQACFGADLGSREMKAWFKGLTPAEQTRRKNFAVQFKTVHDTFRGLSLSNARNISLHRTGVAPVEVNITGRFGVSHIGTPIKHVPTSESTHIIAGDDPALQWAATLPPDPVQPTWTDFSIDGRPLFQECQAYLQEARKVVAHASTIVQHVHGNNTVTPPPS
jgi:hypothetical protein